jgi:hypothetical protein
MKVKTITKFGEIGDTLSGENVMGLKRICYFETRRDDLSVLGFEIVGSVVHGHRY